MYIGCRAYMVRSIGFNGSLGVLLSVVSQYMSVVLYQIKGRDQGSKTQGIPVPDQCTSEQPCLDLKMMAARFLC